MVKVIVPATSANLGPGFDTLGVAIDMHNIIEMQETGILDDVIEVEGHGEALERPENNLVYIAAQEVWKRTGYKPYGLLIREEIGIPVARGLGSSSSAIVGGLMAANELVRQMSRHPGLSTEELLTVAVEMEGHPDNVTPALLGGFCVACVEEGKPYYVRIDPPAGLHAVVAIPEVPLHTKKARGVLPGEVKMADAVYNLSRSSLLVAALLTGRTDLLRVATKDRWHQPYRAPLVPGLHAVFHAALDAGAKGVFLSGSGPSVLALVEQGAEQVGLAMEGAFQWHGSDCHFAVTSLCKDGCRIVKD